MIKLSFSGITLRLRTQGTNTQVFDPVRKKWYLLTPEEHVRQYILRYLTEKCACPLSLISVEKKAAAGTLTHRFDLLVYDRKHRPWMLVECKEPETPVTENTLYQLLRYHSVLPCRYWVLTNGHQVFCADAADINDIRWMDNLPLYQG